MSEAWVRCRRCGWVGGGLFAQYHQCTEMRMGEPMTTEYIPTEHEMWAQIMETESRGLSLPARLVWRTRDGATAGVTLPPQSLVTHVSESRAPLGSSGLFEVSRMAYTGADAARRPFFSYSAIVEAPPPSATEITPALTPEQWAAYEAGETIEYLHTENERIRISPTQARPRFPHLSVALGNAALEDGDPRKITREDVAAVLDVAAQLPTFGGGPDGDNIADPELTKLAAKLAAIVPPREG